MFTPKSQALSRSSSQTGVTGRAVGTPQSSGKDRGGLFATKRKSTVFGRTKSFNVSDFHSRIAEQTGADHILREYGATVPVLVTETLTLSDRGSQPSVKLDSNGWAWLVCGRRLIVWNYKMHKSGQCYDLSLPATGCLHNARLVTVFEIGDQQTAACVAVSREGSIRFWHNVSLEGNYTELKAELNGGECAMIVALQEFGCIVGTTISTLVSVYFPPSTSGIRYRMLKLPQGRLTGIGRYVSSMFFGSTPQPTTKPPTLCSMLAGELLNDDFQALYVLTSEGLQKWAVGRDTEKMLYHMNLELLFIDNLAGKVWNQEPKSLPYLRIELMDMQLINDGVIIFGGGINSDVSNNVHYALGTLYTEGEDTPQSFLDFMVINHSMSYIDTASLPAYNLLLPKPNSHNVFLYDAETVICIADGRTEQVPEVVDFPSLGAGFTDGIPVFLSIQGLLVSVQDNVPIMDTSVSEALLRTTTFAKLDTSIVSNAKRGRISEMTTSDEKLPRFRAAFLASIQGTRSQSQLIVNELFPDGIPLSSDAGALLDVLVSDLSLNMINDYPASDPRWGESLPRDACSTSASASLILLHQLNDKMQAHDLYIQFLKNVGLWDRMLSVQVRDGMLSTRMLLCEHSEKLEAVKALRDIHTEHAQLIDKVIVKVVRQRCTVAPTSNLTPQDLFYREVSLVDDLLVCLVDHEEQMLTCDVTSRDIVSLVSTVNVVLMTMIYSAVQYRQSHAAMYQCRPGVAGSQPGREEFIAWTASTGHRGVRSVIHRQLVLTVEKGLPESQTSHEKVAFFQQLFELTDIVLDGFRVQLESIKATPGGHYADVLRQYETERNTLIEPFMTHKQYERATSLAEKYCHFSVLIRLCEELDNQDRLKHYMNQFQDKGFSDFVFKWYMEAGKRGKLMTSELSTNPLLSRFLQTKENQFMSWLHDINGSNYYQAHSTLLNLANDEVKYAGKKKTLLSLSKLAALAADDLPNSAHSNVEDIDNELDLLLHQEQLLICPEIKEHLGTTDVDNMNVLTPVELIELHTGEYNVDANEFDFKKSIDLLSFIRGRNEDVNMNELLVTIWAKALLRNSWDNLSATDPMDVCRDTVFFRTVELVSEDMKLDQYLPPVDDLLASDLLRNIGRSKDFEYLVRAMYERIQRMMQEID